MGLLVRIIRIPTGPSTATFFVPDAVLDVEGPVCNGLDQIKDLYVKLFKTQPGPKDGAFHMLFTNEKIVVKGATATADLISTEMVDLKPTDKPLLTEQGLEHDELVKRDGRWLPRYRKIRADAGLVGIFRAPRGY
jgi:SnoaL-like domain